MKKHLIESYYKWVYSKLHPFLLLHTEPENVKAYLVTSKGLKVDLKTQLLKDSLDDKTEIEMSLLVQRCQWTVTIMLDHIFHHMRHESITPELKVFYAEVTADLEEIFAFLQNTWGRYFNAGLNMPLSHWVSEGSEVEKQWKKIAKMLIEPEENIRIVKILDGCIKGLLYPASGQAITYETLSWLKNLFTELSGLYSSKEPGYASLTELLISWNFNDRTFIAEVFNKIISETEKKESGELRIEFLRACSKQVGEVLEKVRVPFFPAMAAKKMIMDSLAKEIDYLELIRVVMETKEFKEGAKIHTSLSVPELALIIRLFKDSGVFTNPNETEILKFFATHFTTKRKSGFSYNYLRRKYYQVNESLSSDLDEEANVKSALKDFVYLKYTDREKFILQILDEDNFELPLKDLIRRIYEIFEPKESPSAKSELQLKKKIQACQSLFSAIENRINRVSTTKPHLLQSFYVIMKVWPLVATLHSK